MDIFGIIIQPTIVRVLPGGVDGLRYGVWGLSFSLGALRCLPAWAKIPLGFCSLPSDAVPAPKARVWVSPLFLSGPPGGQRGSLWVTELLTALGALMLSWSLIGGPGCPDHPLLLDRCFQNVFVSCGCCNKPPHIYWLNNADLLSCSSGSQGAIQSHPPKINMSAGRIPFWRLWRENPFLLILIVGRTRLLGLVGGRSLFSC